MVDELVYAIRGQRFVCAIKLWKPLPQARKAFFQLGWFHGFEHDRVPLHAQACENIVSPSSTIAKNGHFVTVFCNILSETGQLSLFCGLKQPGQNKMTHTDSDDLHHDKHRDVPGVDSRKAVA